MKHNTEMPGPATYLYKNWFWIALACLFIFAFIKRDMNINVSTSGISVTTPAFADTKPKATKAKQKETPKEPTIAKGSMQIVNPFSYFGEEEKKEIVVAASKIDDPEIWYTVKEKKEIEFVKRFKKIAIKEMKLYGIPASIKLAQGIVGSKGGLSPAALKGNNFFQVPCDKASTDQQCLKEYQTAWKGFRDHSNYITEGQFKYLVKLGHDNYHQWAKGLEMGGYSPNSNYDEQLIAVIEKYELHKFDQL